MKQIRVYLSVSTLAIKYHAKTLLSVFVLVLCYSLLFSCASTRMKVKVTKPAEVDLSDTKRIVMGGIEGEGGLALSEDLTSALFASGRFEILERDHLQEVMNEHNFNMSGAIDKTTAAQIGNIIGSAALVFGRVSEYKYTETLEHSDYEDDDGHRHRRYTRRGKVHVTALIKIIDVETMKILAVKKLNSDHLIEDTHIGTLISKGFGAYFEGMQREFSIIETVSSKDKKPPHINPDPLFANARKLIVKRFMKMIAPYQVEKLVSFEKYDDCSVNDRGIQFAKTGDMYRAHKCFYQALKQNPQLDKAYFNLGVCLMCRGKFDIAIKCLDKAYGMTPCQKYSKTLATARQWKTDSEQLYEQTGHFQ